MSNKNQNNAPSTTSEFLKEHMPLFDTRLYRTLAIFDEKNKSALVNTFYPQFDYGSYAMDYYATPTAIQRKIEAGGDNVDKEQIEALKKQKDEIQKFINEHKVEYLSARSFIHPYALVKLPGTYGNSQVVKKGLGYDQYDKRKFYEIDGDDTFSGNYSKSPTTTALVRWGQESARGKTPYSFQDFAFCKWWNKIENNRLITLRRYAMPVTDSIEFADYDIETNASNNSGKFEAGGQKFSGSNSTSPFVPLATAVTYFGEDTGNKLSDILTFSAKYNWTQVKTGEGKDPITISASQNDEGNGLVNANGGGILGGISSGLGLIAKTMGFFGEVSNGKTINLEGSPGSFPPDPYSTGPYENRILGPINVITNTYRRDRGLSFTGDGLKITFEYVSRPIAGINNKAVLLDLLANMLILTYSSGTWFGGMWRFRTESPAVYPFKYGDTMNKLYRGQLWGKDGAIESLTKNVFADGGNALSTFLPDAITAVSNMFSGAVNAIKSLFSKGDQKEQTEEEAKAAFKKALDTGSMKAIQKVIAAKALKGTTVPFIQNQRALLTGEPVGDWHLTVGNPLNPIAMIGNLIVTDMSVTFSDELGPDDFPIGFKAVVTLNHGLGRDRDAIESMFNRGYGRIYTLSDHFRSSADGETKVDENTGGKWVNTSQGRTLYEETRNTYYGGGSAFIAKTQHNELRNKGSIYNGDTQNLDSLKPTSATNISQTIPTYYVNPWQMGYTM